jgi:uncharacterized protein (TIGR02453 family)
VHFKKLFSFLEQLQLNNHKDWMDAHRTDYFEVRDFFIEWLDGLNAQLGKLDDDYFNTPGKKAINRINNNLFFHPNRPVYKDYFSGGLDQKSKQGDFYLEIGVNEIYVGSGYWHPDSKQLRSIREAIDYNGDEFLKILKNKKFKSIFGGMLEGDVLKTSPKGFSIDHPHINLLRRKSFAATVHFEREDVFRGDFNDRIIEAYEVLLPFRRYLNTAVSV